MTNNTTQQKTLFLQLNTNKTQNTKERQQKDAARAKLKRESETFEEND